MSHIRKIAKNTFYNYVYIISQKLTNFVLRTVFIYTLGVTYLGVNGLFTNVLGIMSFAELGIGSILNASLYKPVLDGDKDKIYAYIKIYRAAYRGIAVFILIVGLAICPFLKYFIKGIDDIGEIRYYYIIYIFNTAISYFSTYYYSIACAEEKGYILTRINTFFNFLTALIQIIVLLITHNFYFYLLSQSFVLIAQKIYQEINARQLFPFLFETREFTSLDKNEHITLFRNFKAGFINKFMDVSITSTDNLIISIMLGLNDVGYISNYIMIENTLYSLAYQIFSSMPASLANIIHRKEANFREIILNSVMLLSAWIYGTISICYIFLVRDFISLWLGENFTYGMPISILFGYILFSKGLRIAYFINKDIYAIFYDDYMYSFFAGIINIIFSVIFTLYFGIIGVYIGTLITELFLLLIKSSISYKRITSKEKIHYYKFIFKTYFSYTFIFIICFIINKYLIFENKYLSFLIKATITFFISNIIYILFYKNKYEAKFLFNIVKSKICNFIKIYK